MQRPIFPSSTLQIWTRHWGQLSMCFREIINRARLRKNLTTSQGVVCGVVASSNSALWVLCGLERGRRLECRSSVGGTLVARGAGYSGGGRGRAGSFDYRPWSPLSITFAPAPAGALLRACCHRALLLCWWISG